ncbi:MAG: hypothetical protein H0X64_09330 [Gemmatimonadaceae bacterium]|nr:hypothetical protein [Gemmatimonadaceae bacterium]
MRYQSHEAATPETGPAADKELPAVVIEYLLRLRRLPVGAWNDAAQALVAAERDAGSAPSADSIAAAHAALRRIVAGVPGLAVQTQRRVQNMVEMAGTCMHISDCTKMKRAALTAALALAVRSALGEPLFAKLYAPFEQYIPLADLARAAADDLALA